MNLAGTKVGNIRLLEPLGAGGLGAVYAARDERLNREVAVKVVQPDRSSPLSKVRILREARALSQLQHPNICSLYEYIEGLDYDCLVLERIHGDTLASLMQSGQLPADRLDLARQIASALVAAHSKGIAHRDLKPANVMVTQEGTVKVLDFGLARWAEEGLGGDVGGAPPSLEGMTPGTEPLRPLHLEAPTEVLPAPEPSGTASTQIGHIIGTPYWMSPEQAKNEPITPACDLYTFGLLLQEVLTGEAAYPANLNMPQLLLKVGAGETLPVRGLDHHLADLIERMKAPRPEDRPTAAEVLARLDWIRSKRVRRLRWGAAAGLLIALLAGGVKYTTDLNRERKAALAAHREAELAREQEAAVVEFLVGLFKVTDPGEARGRTVTARELLDRAAASDLEHLEVEPLVRARLLDTIGELYHELGLYSEAAALLEKALALREQAQGREHLDTAAALHRLGSVYRDQHRPEALPLLEEALALRERLLGPEDVAVADTLNTLAVVYGFDGKLEQAKPLLERALVIRQSKLGAEHPEVAVTLNNLAIIAAQQGRPEDSEALFRRGLEIRERALPSDHPDLAINLVALGTLYGNLGRATEARAHYTRALPILQKALGNEHPRVALVHSNLGNTLMALSELEASEAELRKAVEIREKALGAEHPSVAESSTLLGLVLLRRDQVGEAEKRLRRAVLIFERHGNATGNSYRPALVSLIELMRQKGREAEAAIFEAKLSRLPS